MLKGKLLEWSRNVFQAAALEVKLKHLKAVREEQTKIENEVKQLQELKEQENVMRINDEETKKELNFLREGRNVFNRIENTNSVHDKTAGKETDLAKILRSEQ